MFFYLFLFFICFASFSYTMEKNAHPASSYSQAEFKKDLAELDKLLAEYDKALNQATIAYKPVDKHLEPIIKHPCTRSRTKKLMKIRKQTASCKQKLLLVKTTRKICTDQLALLQSKLAYEQEKLQREQAKLGSLQKK